MLTILDIAIAWGAKESDTGAVNGEELERLGLPIMGGCQTCGATIAAYNATPNRNGYLSCNSDVCAVDPYENVEEFATDYPPPKG